MSPLREVPAMAPKPTTSEAGAAVREGRRPWDGFDDVACGEAAAFPYRMSGGRQAWWLVVPTKRAEGAEGETQ